MDEDVARLAVADDEAVALGAIEPLHLGGLERPTGLDRPARPAGHAAEALTFPTGVFLAQASLARGRGGGLVEVDDFGDLPALGPANHVAGDGRAFRRVLAARAAQAGDVEEDVLQIG